MLHLTRVRTSRKWNHATRQCSFFCLGNPAYSVDSDQKPIQAASNRLHIFHPSGALPNTNGQINTAPQTIFPTPTFFLKKISNKCKPIPGATLCGAPSGLTLSVHVYVPTVGCSVQTSKVYQFFQHWGFIKHCRSRPDATLCGAPSGSALFAHVYAPLVGRPVQVGEINTISQLFFSALKFQQAMQAQTRHRSMRRPIRAGTVWIGLAYGTLCSIW